MKLRPWLRFSGLAAVWGGVLGAAVSLLASAAYYNHDWSRGEAPAWTRAFIRLLGDAFSYASAQEVYHTYGRAFLPALLLILLGVLGLQACCLLRSGKHAGWGYRLVVAGLVMGLLGNLADYWFGPQSLGQVASVVGFVVGTELGMLVYTAGAVMMARLLWQEGVLPAPLAALMAFAPLLGLLLLFWGVRHIPGGFYLPVSLSWVLIGLKMWIQNARDLLRQAPGAHLQAKTHD